MFFLLQKIAALIKILHSENGSRQVASAVALGFFCGFSPMFSLQAVLVYGIVLFFRVQIAAFFLSWLAFSLLFLPLYRVLDFIGYQILDVETLRPLFTFMQKSDVFSLSQFYNSIVMGGFAVGLLGSPFIYFGSLTLLRAYREKVLAYIKTTKYYAFLKSTVLVKLYGFYKKYEAI